MNSKYLNDIVRYLFILFRFAFIVVIFIFSCLLFYYVVKYAYPFIIALVLALLINPFVNFLEKRTHLSRGLASFFAILSILSLICGTCILLIIEMIEGINDLTQIIPERVKWIFGYLQDSYTIHILPLWQKIIDIISTLNEGQQATIHSNIQDLGQKLATSLTEIGQTIVSTLTHIIVALPTLFTVVTFILMATFFISKDWYKIIALFESKIPLPAVRNVSSIFIDLQKALKGYVRAQVTLMIITGITVFIGLILLRVDHALTISIVAMLVDILPYLGTGTLLIPWGVFTFLTGNYFLTIGIGSLYALTVIQRQMIEPKILSSSIGTNPLLTLVSLFVGFKVMGILGLVLGPICLIIITTLLHSGILISIWNYVLGKNRS